MSMPCNLSGVDRVVRTLIGLALIGTAALGWFGSAAGIVASVAGGVLVLTAIVRFCPLYRVFGLSTCAGKPASTLPAR